MEKVEEEMKTTADDSRNCLWSTYLLLLYYFFWKGAIERMNPLSSFWGMKNASLPLFSRTEDGVKKSPSWLWRRKAIRFPSNLLLYRMKGDIEHVWWFFLHPNWSIDYLILMMNASSVFLTHVPWEIRKITARRSMGSLRCFHPIHSTYLITPPFHPLRRRS